MPNASVRAAGGAVSGDDRSPLVCLIEDVASLARMAGITYGMVERALIRSRATSFYGEIDIYVFNFSSAWIDELTFAAMNVMERARSIEARIHQLEQLYDEIECAKQMGREFYERCCSESA